MSKNLYRTGYDIINKDNAKLIDNNGRCDEMIEEALEEQERRRQTDAGDTEEGNATAEGDGFSDGISAQTVDAAGSADGEAPGNVIKADTSAMIDDARAQADQIIADADAKAEEIVSQAKQKADDDSKAVMDDARECGYSEGIKKTEDELAKRKSEYDDKQHSLEERYGEMFDELEPQLVDTISQIYEHVFDVDLTQYNDIVSKLAVSTIRSSENSRNYIVHVSHDDFQNVSSHKDELKDAAGGSDCTVDVIEDVSLLRGQCMIENEYGILDCGIDTELAELHRRLRILSFKKDSADDRNG